MPNPNKETYSLLKIGDHHYHHGRLTMQNCKPPCVCPQCGYPVEVITFGITRFFTELNFPSPRDNYYRLGAVIIPTQCRIESIVESQTARPALTLRGHSLPVQQEEEHVSKHTR